MRLLSRDVHPLCTPWPAVGERMRVEGWEGGKSGRLSPPDHAHTCTQLHIYVCTQIHFLSLSFSLSLFPPSHIHPSFSFSYSLSFPLISPSLLLSLLCMLNAFSSLEDPLQCSLLDRIPHAPHWERSGPPSVGALTTWLSPKPVCLPCWAWLPQGLAWM